MADDADDNAFYCMACNKPFHSPLYSITRSSEQMHFYPGERLPEAEVLFAESVGDYCSQACLDLNRARLLNSNNVRATYPGPGPIESCSRCSNPVDMSSPHWTWTEEKADVAWENGIEQIQPTAANLLAVLCKDCDLNNDQYVESNESVPFFRRLTVNVRQLLPTSKAWQTVFITWMNFNTYRFSSLSAKLSSSSL